MTRRAFENIRTKNKNYTLNGNSDYLVLRRVYIEVYVWNMDSYRWKYKTVKGL